MRGDETRGDETAGAEAAPEVLVWVAGGVGRLSLNRPRVMNALTQDMILEIRGALDAWRDDDSIHSVLITGEGDRGLCAGGDIVTLFRDATTGNEMRAESFFWHEYRLNLAIARYPKPYVAVMDGVVLGGGIGVSAHGSHRVVTERSRLGMPETTIGFAPDVGGGWLLAHAPGELGTYLALTGNTIGAGDAIALGLADFFLPSDRIAEFIAAVEVDGPDSACVRFAEPAPAPQLEAERHWIDTVFAPESVQEILERLEHAPGEVAAEVARKLAVNSPSAVVLARESVRRSRHLSLEDALRQDFCVSANAIRSHDLVEGIRAQVVDKDRQPRWSPATVAEVDHRTIESFFELPSSRQLRFE
ncbi:MAG: caiD 5 [Microbacteriaceae bacterium]|nr:caiD 5 [Microbacteriaceae bacterium]